MCICKGFFRGIASSELLSQIVQKCGLQPGREMLLEFQSPFCSSTAPAKFQFEVLSEIDSRWRWFDERLCVK